MKTKARASYKWAQNVLYMLCVVSLQTEEVKRANRLILATKCHVIRDAQIAEKHVST